MSKTNEELIGSQKLTNTLKCKHFRDCINSQHGDLQQCIDKMSIYYGADIDGDRVFCCPHCNMGYKISFPLYMRDHHAHNRGFDRNNNKKSIIQSYRESMVEHPASVMQCRTFVTTECQTEDLKSSTPCCLETAMMMIAEFQKMAQELTRMNMEAAEDRRHFITFQDGEFRKREQQNRSQEERIEMHGRKWEQRMQACDDGFQVRSQKLANDENLLVQKIAENEARERKLETLEADFRQKSEELASQMLSQVNATKEKASRVRAVGVTKSRKKKKAEYDHSAEIQAMSLTAKRLKKTGDLNIERMLKPSVKSANFLGFDEPSTSQQVPVELAVVVDEEEVTPRSEVIDLTNDVLSKLMSAGSYTSAGVDIDASDAGLGTVSSKEQTELDIWFSRNL